MSAVRSWSQIDPALKLLRAGLLTPRLHATPTETVVAFLLLHTPLGVLIETIVFYIGYIFRVDILFSDLSGKKHYRNFSVRIISRLTGFLTGFLIGPGADLSKWHRKICAVTCGSSLRLGSNRYLRSPWEEITEVHLCSGLLIFDKQRRELEK